MPSSWRVCKASDRNATQLLVPDLHAVDSQAFGEVAARVAPRGVLTASRLPTNLAHVRPEQANDQAKLSMGPLIDASARLFRGFARPVKKSMHAIGLDRDSPAPPVLVPGLRLSFDPMVLASSSTCKRVAMNVDIRLLSLGARWRQDVPPQIGRAHV